MQISIVTQEDLQELKDSILSSLESLKEELLTQSTSSPDPVLLKSHQVQRMLAISQGTLQNMRVNGIIPFSKVGGVIFYDKQDILNIIDDLKQNV
ncbi:DNA-binding protein [Brumimicrobium glaciale]|uniref:DNA-binding protein n=1 Tax=Brumimicrobium glaciale TaxID=200475 RepID=A0A4V1WG77_9FLAO|nr:helix-turn-helix domain-containing protein [Brumimicrobium glaciale]RYM35741.1 DNA-binding protein [Brumimicrobium glaciale]